MLLRTVYSILDRSPEHLVEQVGGGSLEEELVVDRWHLLAQVVLVDDASNHTDIATDGGGVVQDMQAGGVWQKGPPEARYPRDTWPASRDFRKRVPEEEDVAPLVSGPIRTSQGFACTSWWRES